MPFNGKPCVAGQPFLQGVKGAAVYFHPGGAAGTHQVVAVAAGGGVAGHAVPEHILEKDGFLRKPFQVAVHGGKGQRGFPAVQGLVDLLGAHRVGAFLQHLQDGRPLFCIFHSRPPTFG